MSVVSLEKGKEEQLQIHISCSGFFFFSSLTNFSPLGSGLTEGEAQSRLRKIYREGNVEESESGRGNWCRENSY